MNNYFSIIGRLTKEVELRYTKDNKPVCDISVAVQNGKEDTSFIKVSLWNKTAETTAKYCKKGDLIGVCGIIRNNVYEDKEGNKHYDYSFVGAKISFLATNKKSEETKKEEIKIEPKQEEEYDPFSEFGESIEISDNFLE